MTVLQVPLRTSIYHTEEQFPRYVVEIFDASGDLLDRRLFRTWYEVTDWLDSYGLKVQYVPLPEQERLFHA